MDNINIIIVPIIRYVVKNDISKIDTIYRNIVIVSNTCISKNIISKLKNNTKSNKTSTQ